MWESAESSWALSQPALSQTQPNTQSLGQPTNKLHLKFQFCIFPTWQFCSLSLEMWLSAGRAVLVSKICITLVFSYSWITKTWFNNEKTVAQKCLTWDSLTGFFRAAYDFNGYIWVPGIPLMVYFFLYTFSYNVVSLKFYLGSAFCAALSKSLVLCRGSFSSLGLTSDNTQQIIFKTVAAILAVWQCLLSYYCTVLYTCCRFLILRSDNFSWLLHLAGHIVLAGRTRAHADTLNGESHFRRCNIWHSWAQLPLIR